MEKMQVRFERCKGCGLCVTVCPKQIVACKKNTGMKRDISPQYVPTRMRASAVRCVR